MADGFTRPGQKLARCNAVQKTTSRNKTHQLSASGSVGWKLGLIKLLHRLCIK